MSKPAATSSVASDHSAHRNPLFSTPGHPCHRIRHGHFRTDPPERLFDKPGFDCDPLPPHREVGSWVGQKFFLGTFTTHLARDSSEG